MIFGLVTYSLVEFQKKCRRKTTCVAPVKIPPVLLPVALFWCQHFDQFSLLHFKSSCWLSYGNGTNAIWTFVAPVLAIVMVSQDSHGNCTFKILLIMLPQDKFLSVSLDQQCVPGTGPSQPVQILEKSHVRIRTEQEGGTCKACFVSRSRSI